MRQDAKSGVICVVDDNVDAVASLSILLDLEGYEVHTAHDGIDGLAAIFCHRPFVAILDIGMPGLSGYDVASQVRATFGDSMRLIALSGWGTDQDVKRAISAGFDNHLTKPADAGQLLGLVRAYAMEAPGGPGAANLATRVQQPD